jgi:hypothetical protein
MWLIVYLNMNDYGNPAIPNRASHRRHQAALRGCIRPIVCDLEG